MLECYFNMKLRKGLAVQSCREHSLFLILSIFLLDLIVAQRLSLLPHKECSGPSAMVFVCHRFSLVAAASPTIKKKSYFSPSWQSLKAQQLNFLVKLN